MTYDANSFLKSLFFGEIREDILFPFPTFSADVRESIEMMNEALTRFAEEHVDSAKWDREAKMPRTVVDACSEMGLMGILVDEEYNGLGLPMMGYGRLFETLGTIDASLSVTVGAHQSIGYKALLLFGTDKQKKQYLPKLATGEMIAAYCLTEPSSGSDAASIQTTATKSEDGKHYILNGSKLWITNGGIADFFTVFAKLPIKQKDGSIKEKVTGFLVEKSWNGISIGPEEHKMGIRASWTNAVFFDNVKVPVENLIGEEGKGFKVAMGVLNHGRLGLAAGNVGGLKKALAAAIEHANERKQFNTKLIDFGMIQEKIATMTINLYAVESMVYFTTYLIDRGDVDYSMESAASKVFATESAFSAIDENIQIWGGSGYMQEYPYERWLRDARISRIFEGTNEILRAFVALAGMQGPGEEIAGLASSIKHPLKGLGLVSDFAQRKVKRSVLGASVNNTHPELKRVGSIIEDATVELANLSEMLIIKHGSRIAEKEFAQTRIANIAIDLFALCCVMSRTTAALESKGGKEACQFELELTELFANRVQRRIRHNVKAVSRNDDETMKSVARKVAELGKYPLDILGHTS